MSKPTLLIQTVYFTEDARGEAEKLGFLLYDQLTRSREDTLGFGPGIPVRIATHADAVRLETEEAEQVVLIPVLGAGTAQDKLARTQVITRLLDWAQQPQLQGKGALLPVFTTPVWREYERQLCGKPLLQHLYEDASASFDHTLLQLVISCCRLLRDETERLHLFISHAKTDLPSTKQAATAISDFTKTNSTAQAFYDTTDLQPGHRLDEQLQAAASEGVFLAVRSDKYSSRSWCQQELLSAKRASVPTLSVEVLRSGEARSYPYAGNGPTVVWREGVEPAENALRVTLRALVEWLRARYFVLEAARLAKDIPASSILPRAPELLDLAQGPLLARESSVVLHPDPELSYAERAVLRAARPRIQLVTPTTLYRGVESGQRSPGPSTVAALREKEIALSVSNVIDDSLIDHGIRSEHVDDAFVYLTRALIGAGAFIAYGGDFRIGGYDELLCELIRTYNAASVDAAESVFSYLPASFERKKIPNRISVNIRALGWSRDLVAARRLDPPEGAFSPARAAVYISDMRRVMAASCFARLLIGGQTLPKKAEESVGYAGAYPGVVEEAWWMLSAPLWDEEKHERKPRPPVYVVGGFGGAAALVASLGDSAGVPELLTAERFSDNQRFQAVSREFAADPAREHVGAAADMKQLVTELSSALSECLSSDAAAITWNGLTVAENKELFRSRDNVRITELVMQGLFNVAAARSGGKLHIELVRGNVLRARSTSAIALPTFRDVPITGAGAALDQVLNNAVSAAKDKKLSLTEVSSQQVDAQWLIIADLGVFNDLQRAELPGAVQKAAAEVARLAVRHEFPRISLVTFAATVLGNVEQIAERMIAGFKPLAAGTTLEWFETDGARFDKIQAYLRQREDVSLVVRELDELAPPPSQPRLGDILAFVRLADDTLRTTLLLPTGAAVSAETTATLTAEALEALTRPSKPPSLEELGELGDQLGKLLFGTVATLFDGNPDRRLVVQHDLASAALPFEALRVNGRDLGLEGGIVRRPSVGGLDLGASSKRPPRGGKLKILLVVNPTQDLEHAEKEAEAIQAMLGDGDFEVNAELRREKATRAAVLEALTDPSYDVFHFTGHAYYSHLDGDGSGLLCAGQERLTLADFQEKKIGPRVVFFNACQSARVRSDVPVVARALAEYVLRSGVEAYLGTSWVVDDKAAADFAASVYRALAGGKQLDEAVLLARKLLRQSSSAEWANYALYGNGAFQLKTR